MADYWKLIPLLPYFPVLENDEKWKMKTSPESAISVSAIPEIFEELGPLFGSQVKIDFKADFDPVTDRARSRHARPDFHVRVTWEGQAYEFVAEAKTRNTTRVLEEALSQTRRWAQEPDRQRMVIVPYLGERRIERLAAEGVSGLDLCGNGLVIVPGRLLLRRTGQPNRYPESRPARFAYRGTTSLVPRVFLRRAAYTSVGQVHDEIAAAGGQVSLSTVSKALARMVDDLIVERAEGRITLLQGDTLIEQLAEYFVPPEPSRLGRRIWHPYSHEELFRRVENPALPGRPPRMVLSGASSLDQYAAGLRADTPVVYVNDLNEVRLRLGDAWHLEPRFPNLIVQESHDPTLFFDTRRSENGVVYSSPVQTYLELATSGENRDFEIAQQVLHRVLRDVAR